jgi:hypothetical protein
LQLHASLVVGGIDVWLLQIPRTGAAVVDRYAWADRVCC